MLKKTIIGILVGMILIYGVYALIHWTGEVQDIEEMTVTRISYDEVPESIQTSINEMIDRDEDFRYQEINRRSFFTDHNSRSMVKTRYEVFLPPEGTILEIIETGEEDTRHGVMRVVYSFVEKEGDRTDEKEDIVILKVDNYVRGEFRAVLAEEQHR